MYGCVKDCLILIPFRLPHISCFTRSLKCFYSDSDNCPAVRIWLLLHFPHLPRVGLVLPILVFFPLVPSAYQVLHGSIYSFPLIRSSCLLSAGVRRALLCLKVYFWCIHGERCTPHPPTPPPSCSPPQNYFLNKGRYSANSIPFCIYVWKHRWHYHLICNKNKMSWCFGGVNSVSWVSSLLSYLHTYLPIASFIPSLLKSQCVCLVTQSCPTLCYPIDYSPPGSYVQGDSPGKNT